MDINNLDREHIFTEIRKRIDSRNDGKVKVISIVGGAGSGKTIFAHELIMFLGNACTLGTDDYVIGDREYRRKYLEGGNPLKNIIQKLLMTTFQQLNLLEMANIVLSQHMMM